jgi:hypothetical protein
VNDLHASRLPIDAAIANFKKGCLSYDEGCTFMEDDLCDKGLALIRGSLRELDSHGPHAREALIPLLDDPSAAIQVYAAASLVKIAPERALALLRHIGDFSFEEARMTACRLLILHENGGLNY